MPRVRTLPVARRYPGTALLARARGGRLRADFATVDTFLMFVGHPRSGHSLVGALLDAHPNALVAHELDVLKYVEAGFGRDQLFALLVHHQQARVAGGLRSGSGYAYAVPGQWQGRYARLQVIGDKKGGRSTARLAERPELFDRLGATVGVPVRVVQVVRNPYDNIATMHRRGHRLPLEEHADNYFQLAATVRRLRERVPADRFHELRLEDLILEPTTTLTDLTGFLGLDAPEDYLAACGSVVFPTVRRTRADAPWTAELLEQVAERAKAYTSLRSYRFDEDDGGTDDERGDGGG
jgi:hypothetical protein